MQEEQALALLARLSMAFPTVHLAEHLWVDKLMGIDARDAARAVEGVIDEEKFPTWAAVYERLPVEQEPYNFGNQGGGGRSALPPMSDDERERAAEAHQAAFERWHEFKRTHDVKPGTMGEVIREAFEEIGEEVDG